ncbi:MAG: YHS domain-containing protein [Bifidobacterium sp.]|jgi:YHS domain-containing protein|nr:YHS domain-containing protein [Bifidobacterium sp.]
MAQTAQDTYCIVKPTHKVDPAQAEAKGLYRDVNGKRYYFCCNGCLKKFDANPAQYTKA